MAELNDKLITYGNLSTFYDKLQEQGLGGNAIEEVSELPNASENKDKLFRLESDDNVYVSELKSRTTTTTNRLPDAQQIDKAYLYDGEDNSINYYKGAYHIVLNGNETYGYMWYQEGYIVITSKNAETIVDGDCASAYFDIGTEATINEETRTITIESPGSGLCQGTIRFAYILIPAIYNAPESAQIGNAYLIDGANGYKGIYDGTLVTFIDTDGSGEEVTGYKWAVDGEVDYIATSKPASEIYYDLIDNGDDTYSTNIDVTVWCVYPEDDNNSEISSVSQKPASGEVPIYIPQLNAPDSEQVGHATISEDYFGGTNVYTGEEETIVVDGNTLTVYKWLNENYPQFPIYSTKRASEIYNTDKDSDDIHFYLDEEGNILEMTFANEDLLSISTVKYQRKVVTEEWDWEKVATEEYVDDAIATVDVKPITNVESLPDAEANKDSVLRLEGDEQVYISKLTTITPTEARPDSEQIGKAFIQENGMGSGEGFYYIGKYTITCSDGVLEWYGWKSYDGESFIISAAKAENLPVDFSECTELFYHFNVNTQDWSNVTDTGATTTLSIIDIEEYSSLVEELLGSGSGYGLALYNAPESMQIGNANIFDYRRNYPYIYTGAEVLFEYQGEQKTGYEWVRVNYSTLVPISANRIITEDKAEDIVIFNNWGDSVWTGCRYFEDNNGNISKGFKVSEMDVPQLNVPDSEEVGNGNIYYHSGYYYYTGELATVGNFTGYKWEKIDKSNFIITVGVNAENLYVNEFTNKTGKVKILDNSTGNEIDYTGADYNLVKYQRTADYQWKRVVTEDEIVPEIGENESVFTGATLTVDGSQPSIVASGSTTIVWDDLVASIPSGKSVEVSIVLINTGNSALTPTMQGNYQMMGDGNLTIQASELGLYRGRYISALNKWLIEAIYQEVSGIME